MRNHRLVAGVLVPALALSQVQPAFALRDLQMQQRESGLEELKDALQGRQDPFANLETFADYDRQFSALLRRQDLLRKEVAGLNGALHPDTRKGVNDFLGDLHDKIGKTSARLTRQREAYKTLNGSAMTNPVFLDNLKPLVINMREIDIVLKQSEEELKQRTTFQKSYEQLLRRQEGLRKELNGTSKEGQAHFSGRLDRMRAELDNIRAEMRKTDFRTPKVKTVLAQLEQLSADYDREKAALKRLKENPDIEKTLGAVETNLRGDIHARQSRLEQLVKRLRGLKEGEKGRKAQRFSAVAGRVSGNRKQLNSTVAEIQGARQNFGYLYVSDAELRQWQEAPARLLKAQEDLTSPLLFEAGWEEQKGDARDHRVYLNKDRKQALVVSFGQMEQVHDEDPLNENRRDSDIYDKFDLEDVEGERVARLRTAWIYERLKEVKAGDKKSWDLFAQDLQEFRLSVNPDRLDPATEQAFEIIRSFLRGQWSRGTKGQPLSQQMLPDMLGQRVYEAFNPNAELPPEAPVSQEEENLVPVGWTEDVKTQLRKLQGAGWKVTVAAMGAHHPVMARELQVQAGGNVTDLTVLGTHPQILSAQAGVQKLLDELEAAEPEEKEQVKEQLKGALASAQQLTAQAREGRMPMGWFPELKGKNVRPQDLSDLQLALDAIPQVRDISSRREEIERDLWDATQSLWAWNEARAEEALKPASQQESEQKKRIANLKRAALIAAAVGAGAVAVGALGLAASQFDFGGADDAGGFIAPDLPSGLDLAEPGIPMEPVQPLQVEPIQPNIPSAVQTPDAPAVGQPIPDPLPVSDLQTPDPVWVPDAVAFGTAKLDGPGDAGSVAKSGGDPVVAVKSGAPSVTVQRDAEPVPAVRDGFKGVRTQRFNEYVNETLAPVVPAGRDGQKVLPVFSGSQYLDWTYNLQNNVHIEVTPQRDTTVRLVHPDGTPSVDPQNGLPLIYAVEGGSTVVLDWNAQGVASVSGDQAVLTKNVFDSTAGFGDYLRRVGASSGSLDGLDLSSSGEIIAGGVDHGNGRISLWVTGGEGLTVTGKDGTVKTSAANQSIEVEIQNGKARVKTPDSEFSSITRKGAPPVDADLGTAKAGPGVVPLSPSFARIEGQEISSADLNRILPAEMRALGIPEGTAWLVAAPDASQIRVERVSAQRIGGKRVVEVTARLLSNNDMTISYEGEGPGAAQPGDPPPVVSGKSLTVLSGMAFRIQIREGDGLNVSVVPSEAPVAVILPVDPVPAPAARAPVPAVGPEVPWTIISSSSGVLSDPAVWRTPVDQEGQSVLFGAGITASTDPLTGLTLVSFPDSQKVIHRGFFVPNADAAKQPAGWLLAPASSGAVYQVLGEVNPQGWVVPSARKLDQFSAEELSVLPSPRQAQESGAGSAGSPPADWQKFSGPQTINGYIQQVLPAGFVPAKTPVVLTAGKVAAHRVLSYEGGQVSQVVVYLYAEDGDVEVQLNPNRKLRIVHGGTATLAMDSAGDVQLNSSSTGTIQDLAISVPLSNRLQAPGSDPVNRELRKGLVGYPEARIPRVESQGKVGIFRNVTQSANQDGTVVYLRPTEHPMKIRLGSSVWEVAPGQMASVSFDRLEGTTVRSQTEDARQQAELEKQRLHRIDVLESGRPAQQRYYDLNPQNGNGNADEWVSAGTLTSRMLEAGAQQLPANRLPTFFGSGQGKIVEVKKNSRGDTRIIAEASRNGLGMELRNPDGTTSRQEFRGLFAVEIAGAYGSATIAVRPLEAETTARPAPAGPAAPDAQPAVYSAAAPRIRSTIEDLARRIGLNLQREEFPWFDFEKGNADLRSEVHGDRVSVQVVLNRGAEATEMSYRLGGQRGSVPPGRQVHFEMQSDGTVRLTGILTETPDTLTGAPPPPAIPPLAMDFIPTGAKGPGGTPLFAGLLDSVKNLNGKRVSATTLTGTLNALWPDQARRFTYDGNAQVDVVTEREAGGTTRAILTVVAPPGGMQVSESALGPPQDYRYMQSAKVILVDPTPIVEQNPANVDLQNKTIHRVAAGYAQREAVLLDTFQPKIDQRAGKHTTERFTKQHVEQDERIRALLQEVSETSAFYRRQVNTYGLLLPILEELRTPPPLAKDVAGRLRSLPLMPLATPQDLTGEPLREKRVAAADHVILLLQDQEGVLGQYVRRVGIDLVQEPQRLYSEMQDAQVETLLAEIKLWEQMYKSEERTSGDPGMQLLGIMYLEQARRDLARAYHDRNESQKRWHQFEGKIRFEMVHLKTAAEKDLSVVQAQRVVAERYREYLSVLGTDNKERIAQARKLWGQAQSNLNQEILAQVDARQKFTGSQRLTILLEIYQLRVRLGLAIFPLDSVSVRPLLDPQTFQDTLAFKWLQERRAIAASIARMNSEIGRLQEQYAHAEGISIDHQAKAELFQRIQRLSGQIEDQQRRLRIYNSIGIAPLPPNTPAGFWTYLFEMQERLAQTARDLTASVPYVPSREEYARIHSGWGTNQLFAGRRNELIRQQAIWKAVQPLILEAKGMRAEVVETMRAVRNPFGSFNDIRQFLPEMEQGINPRPTLEETQEIWKRITELTERVRNLPADNAPMVREELLQPLQLHQEPPRPNNFGFVRTSNGNRMPVLIGPQPMEVILLHDLELGKDVTQRGAPYALDKETGTFVPDSRGVGANAHAVGFGSGTFRFSVPVHRVQLKRGDHGLRNVEGIYGGAVVIVQPRLGELEVKDVRDRNVLYFTAFGMKTEQSEVYPSGILLPDWSRERTRQFLLLDEPQQDASKVLGRKDTADGPFYEGTFYQVGESFMLRGQKVKVVVRPFEIEPGVFRDEAQLEMDEEQEEEQAPPQDAQAPPLPQAPQAQVSADGQTLRIPWWSWAVGGLAAGIAAVGGAAIYVYQGKPKPESSSQTSGLEQTVGVGEQLFTEQIARQWGVQELDSVRLAVISPEVARRYGMDALIGKAVRIGDIILTVVPDSGEQNRDRLVDLIAWITAQTGGKQVLVYPYGAAQDPALDGFSWILRDFPEFEVVDRSDPDQPDFQALLRYILANLAGLQDAAVSPEQLLTVTQSFADQA